MRVTPVILAICLILAAPAHLQAASASRDFPNDECAATANIPSGASGQMTLKLKWKSGGGAPSQVPYTHDFPASAGGCQTGADVTADLMEGLCNACMTAADCDIITGLIGPGFCSGQPCCDGIDPGVSNTINMKTSNGIVTLAKIGIGAIKMEAADNAATVLPGPIVIPASNLTSFFSSTGLGNTVGIDLLPKVTVVIARAGGADGMVTVKIERATPPQDQPFEFTTAGKDDLAFLKGLQDGFAGRGIASAILENRDLIGNTAAAESFYGHALAVTLPPNVLKVTVKAPRGFVNQVDTSATPGPPAKTPALSTWGVAALIGLMLLAGAWILRRTTTMRVNPS